MTSRVSSISALHSAASLLNFIPGSHRGRYWTAPGMGGVQVVNRHPARKLKNTMLTSWDEINEISERRCGNYLEHPSVSGKVIIPSVVRGPAVTQFHHTFSNGAAKMLKALTNQDGGSERKHAYRERSFRNDSGFSKTSLTYRVHLIWSMSE